MEISGERWGRARRVHTLEIAWNQVSSSSFSLASFSLSAIQLFPHKCCSFLCWHANESKVDESHWSPFQVTEYADSLPPISRLSLCSERCRDSLPSTRWCYCILHIFHWREKKRADQMKRWSEWMRQVARESHLLSRFLPLLVQFDRLELYWIQLNFATVILAVCSYYSRWKYTRVGRYNWPSNKTSAHK